MRLASKRKAGGDVACATVVAAMKQGEPRSVQQFSLDAKTGNARIGRGNSTCKHATPTFNPMPQEALQEIADEWLQNQRHIFMGNRIVMHESYFKEAGVQPSNWLHDALVRLSGVPQQEWGSVIKMWRERQTLPVWTDQQIRQLDKAYGLQSILCSCQVSGLSQHGRPVARLTQLHACSP